MKKIFQIIVSVYFISTGFAHAISLKYAPGQKQFSKDTTAAKKDTTQEEPKHRKYTFELSYTSNGTFKGRKDSINHPIISPSFSYLGKHGFTGSLTLCNAGDATNTLDEQDYSIGWDHDWTDKFSTSISETYNHYDKRSSRLRSNINNDFNIGMTYDFKYVQTGLSGDFCHGPKTKYGEAKDYFVTFTLSHDFTFDSVCHSKWSIDIEPKFSASAGTQSFFQLYTKGRPKDSTLIRKIEYEKKLAKFDMLNYEFSLPVTFTRKKFSFQLEWNYNMPQNVPPGQSSVPYSVFSFNCAYYFKGKR